MDQLSLAYVCLDTSMRVTDVSANIEDYGFSDVTVGRKAQDTLDFLVGIESPVKLDLPLVASPAGTPVRVSMLPDADGLTILITDASLIAEHRQKLQQAANDNELLVEQQKRLMRDIENASAELALKNQQLNEASRLQTSFMSGVSHEFRTPLSSIIGYTDLLRQLMETLGANSASERSRLEDGLSHLQAVNRSSKHLLSLVENLLDHGKLDSGEIVIRPSAINLREVFDDIDLLLRPSCASKDIALGFDTRLGSDEPLVWLDDSRLRQCLINLVGNAIKFTDRGGVKVAANWQDEILAIRVSDTGLGISEAELAKIRLPFWQGAEHGKAGTGLGLTITERIVELMGGELVIDSKLGEGTEIRLSIPAPLVTQESIATVDQNCFAGFKVLLAEDDPDISSLIEMLLVERGVLVEQVNNGSLAVDAIKSNRFDLILMDIHMPIMDGYEAISQIRSHGCETPIIVMSASPLDDDRHLAEQAGCNAYLVKPIDIEDVLHIASQLKQ